MIYIVCENETDERLREIVNKFPDGEVKLVKSVDEVPEDVKEWVKVGESINPFPEPTPFIMPEVIDDTPFQVACAEKALKQHKDRKQQNTYALKYLNKHYKK